MKRTNVLIAIIGFFLIASVGFAQSSFDMSPDMATGEHIVGSYFKTDIDTVSMTDGNLRLAIPLLNLPGREIPFNLEMDYNSKFFQSRQVWVPGVGYRTAWDFLGWRKHSGLGHTLTYTSSGSNCFPNNLYTIYWVEPDGTKHSFVLGCGTTINNLTIDTNDSSLTRIQTGTYFANYNVYSESDPTWGVGTLIFKNGNKMILSQRTYYYNCDPDNNCDATHEEKRELRTTNGNSLLSSYLASTPNTSMVTSNGTALNDVLPLADNVGRTFSYTKTTSGTTTTETYTLTDSNGSPKAYTITSNNVSARTPDNMQTITVQMVTSIGLPNGRSYQFQYDSNGYLSTLTFPSGAYIRYTYWYPNPTRQSGWYVASRIISSDGTAASEKTTTYTYNYTTDWSDGCSCYVSGSLPSTVVVDPTSGQTVHNFNPAGSNRETSTQTKTSGGTVLKEVQHTWQSTSLGWLVASETTIIGSYSFVSTFGYDSHNNLINQTDSEQGNILRVIHHTFLNTTAYANAHIWDRPIAEDIQPYDPVGVDDGNGGIDHWSLPSISRTQWQYDTLSLTARSGTIPGWVDPGSNPRGNATVIGRFLNTTNSYMNTTQQYDVLGNLVTVTDPGNHSTQTDYTDRFSDNVNRNSFAYPTQATDAGGFYKQSTYDFNTGLLKQTTDSLSRVTTTTYDVMNRTTQINYPDGGQTTYSFDDATPKTVEATKVDTAGNVGQVTTIFDKLYRVTQKQTADPAGTIYADTQYDGKGRKSQVSNPYRSGDTVVWTTFTYDAADRTSVKTNPDGSTIQYSYTNNQTTVTDEAANQRRYTYDRYSRLKQVDEPNPTLSSPLTTTYTYNVVGKMIQSNQSGQTRSRTFDYLGRLTNQTLPESGTTTFSYNSDSLLTSKTDARGVTTTYAYNSVHKLTSQTYSDGTPSVTFQYDTTNRRTQMTDGLGTATYQYDAMDRQTQEQRTLTSISGTFTTSYAYNLRGDLKQMTYPSGRVVNFNYTTGGGCCNSRLSSVVDQTTSTTVAGSISFDAAGDVTSRTLGNGMVETFGYNNRLQETSIVETLTGTQLMNFTYIYGTSGTNTGRVLSRTDSIQPEHGANYTYDSLYRLSQAAAPDSSWSIGWTFDALGNRLTQTPTGLATGKIGSQTVGYTNNRNNANSYDAVGNQTNDGLHNYGFNAINQITQVDGGTATYGYDGDGRRMKKSYNGEATYTFYDSKGNAISEFTTSNAVASATAASAGDQSFYHTADKLGSAILVMAGNGTVIENNRTAPFGEAWLSDMASTNDKKFTTYLRDVESGLDYAMHRFYGNTAGRFLSVDSVDGDSLKPTALNRYAYLLLDPLNDTDPTGLEGQQTEANTSSPLDQATTFGIGVEDPPFNIFLAIEANWSSDSTSKSDDAGIKADSPSKPDDSSTVHAMISVSAFCKSSPEDRILASIEFGAVRWGIAGVVLGAGGGAAAFGFGAIPGAILGGFLGGTFGAARGALIGSGFAGACSLAGAYQ